MIQDNKEIADPDSKIKTLVKSRRQTIASVDKSVEKLEYSHISDGTVKMVQPFQKSV